MCFCGVVRFALCHPRGPSDTPSYLVVDPQQKRSVVEFLAREHGEDVEGDGWKNDVRSQEERSHVASGGEVQLGLGRFRRERRCVSKSVQKMKGKQSL